MLRAWKRRRVAAGTKPTVGEVHEKKQRLRIFLERVADPGAAVDSKKTAKKGIPYEPNVVVARALDLALLRGIGAGLSSYIPQRLLGL